MQQVLQFTHRLNPDGTFDSICRSCGEPGRNDSIDFVLRNAFRWPSRAIECRG